jgi:hypothetical protein
MGATSTLNAAIVHIHRGIDRERGGEQGNQDGPVARRFAVELRRSLPVLTRHAHGGRRGGPRRRQHAAHA